MSWLITSDVIRGRNRLNFSEWGVPRTGGEGGEGGEGGFRGEGGGEGGRGMSRVIQNGSMPPWYYTILHPDGNLSPAEKQQLIDGLNTSLQGGGAFAP